MISEAFNLVDPVKIRVADYFIEMGALPGNNNELGLPEPENLLGTSVRSVVVRQGGRIQVQLGVDAKVQMMTFVPFVSSSGSHLFWRCQSDTVDKGVLEKLRPTCEHKPSTKETQLQRAIYFQDLAEIDHLLVQGADPDTFVVGLTSLMLAVDTGNSTIIQRLLDAGAKPNLRARTHDGYTPLISAIRSQKPEIVELLLNSQASAQTLDLRGRSPRDHAVVANTETGGVFTYLIDASLNPQFKAHPAESFKRRQTKDGAHWAYRPSVDSGQISPLELAIHSRDLEKVRRLVEQGANVNQLTSNESRYLIEASKRGHANLVSLLIDQGARVDSTDKLGRTAYLAAVGSGHVQVADILVGAGADTLAVDNNGVDAMQMFRHGTDREIRTLQIASTGD